MIDILRGDKTEAVTLRRVAFVGSATVREVTGTAEKLSGVDRWMPLLAGVKLAPGDIIRTGQGTVVLRMTDSGSFVKVTPHVMLRLAPFEQGWDRGVLSGREEQEGFVVRTCRGAARFRHGTDVWQAVTVNAVLPEGATVRLAHGAILDLYQTVEQRLLRLESETETVLRASRRAGPASIAAVLP